MIPLIDKIESSNGLNVFTTTDGISGCAVALDLIDIESENAELKADHLSLWFRSLSPKLRARFILAVGSSSEALSVFPRASSLKRLGFKTKNLCLVLETVKTPFHILRGRKESQIDSVFIGALQGIRDLGFRFREFDLEQTRQLFVADQSSWVSTIGSIETGTESIGVVRLLKPSQNALTILNLAKAVEVLPAPFEIRISVERLAASQTELFLQRRLKQFKSDSSGVGDAKASAAESTLVETSVSGEALLNYELTVVCKRPSKEKLREDLRSIAAAMKNLGDVFIETIGAGPSFVASQPGSSMHLPILEKESVLPLFIPLFTTGEAKPFVGEAVRAVSVHRRDGTLFHLDLLSQSHQNGNALVIGSSGRGKSVYLGTLTQCLLNDPNVRMIKVDVGGSHSRECAMNGGVEFKINIDKPSGLNPFALVNFRNGGNEFVRSVLGQFLESLLREEGETRLSKSIRSQIDDHLRVYLEMFEGEASLDSFFDFADNLPRRDLLARWCKTGLYANAFRGDGSQQDRRLRYFNFAEVFQAADPEFAQAAMAAVLATFNLEMKLNPNKRLVLVCDETPFFIERCFEFFKFSAANVRKFGASVVLVVQLSRHLVVNDDTGVIDNCSHRFLFSSDGPKEEFCARLQLSNWDFDILSSLTSSRSFSELLYQSSDCVRSLRLYLTKEEYWRLTSSQTDRLKFDSLMQAVPGLKVEEAIRCLSVQ